MVASAAISTYRRTAVETADPGRLILMAYEGAIQALRQAEDSLSAKDFEAKGRQVVRAQDFVGELLAGLNMDAGPIAANLSALYRYILRNLCAVDPAGESRRLAESRHILEELRSAWQTIIEGPQLREVPRTGRTQVAL